MALWKDTTPGTPTQTAVPPAKDTFASADRPAAAASNVSSLNPSPAAAAAPRNRERPEMKESVIASDLTIEGKIVGSGHVRLAGRFKGDVQVDGNLTIDTGASLDGQVRAQTVTVSGELKGNIESAKRVELQEGGVITGDVKAGSLTVAAGSRMRGQVEFGWEEDSKAAPRETKGFGTAT
jgi:cytoskeletal protein CcmA (bactofilin family)